MKKRPAAFIFLFCSLGALWAFYYSKSVLTYLVILITSIILLFLVKKTILRITTFLIFCFCISSIHALLYKKNYINIVQNLHNNNTFFHAKVNNVYINEDGSKKLLILAKQDNNPHIFNLILRLHDSASALKIDPNDEITFKAKALTFTKPLSAVHFNELQYGLANNIHGKITIKDSFLIEKIIHHKKNLLLTLRENLKNKLLNYLTIKEAALLIALIIGENSLLDNEQMETFKIIGAQHLLAVSGLQVSMLTLFIYFIISSLLALMLPRSIIHKTKPIACISAMIFIWFFVALCGFPKSAIRAAFMASILFLPNLVVRKIDIFDSLYASGCILILINPAYILDLGFLLSYACVFGLTQAYELSKNLLKPLKTYSLLLFYAVSLFISCISAYLITLPIIAVCFGETYPLSIISNFLLLPLISSIQSMAILLALLGCWLNSFVFIKIAAFFSSCIEIVATFISEYIYMSFFIPIKNNYLIFITCLILYIIFILVLRKKIKTTIFFCLIFFINLIIIYWPSSSLFIYSLPVGQGDSTLIQTSNKKNILIDAAGNILSKFDPGKMLIVPLLKRRGVEKIDLLIVTHPDADHILGFLAVLDNFTVSEIWLSKTDIDNENLRLFLHKVAKQKPQPIIKTLPLIYNTHDIDDLKIEVLYPQYYNDSMSLNNNSLVIKLFYNNIAMLWPGDIEMVAENVLLDSHINLQADILKAPHHGSKSSSSDKFIEAVNPKTVIFSTGLHNRFNFPHQEVVEKYQKNNCQILDTAKDGEIIIEISEEKLSVTTYKKSYQQNF